jgi:HAD superfamily hydrolase (TIGR01509 family)
MQKAFIFDLDGVLIDDESLWEQRKVKLYRELLGEEIQSKLGSTLGVNLDEIYERASRLGATIGKTEFNQAFFTVAPAIYRQAPLTKGVEALAEFLDVQGFLLGIVSASPESWIQLVVKRLSFKHKLGVVVSLYDLPHLKHKPAPDGYLEAMKRLGTDARHTAVLEDSNTGIQSARAAGAFTIALKQNVVDGYIQNGANAYANTAADVAEIIKHWQPGV